MLPFLVGLLLGAMGGCGIWWFIETIRTQREEHR